MARISPTRFYTDVLGADLRNTRWSWGAHDPILGRVYLRVWTDEEKTIDGARFVMVLRRSPGRKLAGLTERRSHLELAAAGAEMFGVLCVPDGPRDPDRPRSIRSFDAERLLRLGRVIELPDGLYAEVTGTMDVRDLARPSSGATSLQADLTAIVRQRGLSATERETLVSARIGQGAFRTAVLARWEGGCAVTGSRTLEAIRASHIKPWRDSTNEERLDPANGLPLLATLDALFDSGLVSFAHDGRLLVSHRLSRAERQGLGLDSRRLRRPPAGATLRYLAEHRARSGLQG